jgi:molecular chaperone DnaJ
MKHHPDSSSGDDDSFRRVQEAYEVLSDTERRTAYDRSQVEMRDIPRARRPWKRHEPPVRSYQPVSHSGGGRFGVSFIEKFFEDFVPNPFWRLETPRVHVLSLDLILSPQEATIGGEVPVRLPVSVECARCRGWGCPACFGSGVIESERELSIQFPAGIRSGQEVSISLDNAGIAGFELHIAFVIDINY